MKTITKKEHIYQDIEKHGVNLNAIFNTGIENVTLCKKLRRLENKAHQLTTDYCNGTDGITSENWAIYADTILLSVDRVLGQIEKKIPIFVNGDARGYALKIDSEYVREHNLKIFQDWGGFGIIAPDFSQ